MQKFRAPSSMNHNSSLFIKYSFTPVYPDRLSEKYKKEDLRVTFSRFGVKIIITSHDLVKFKMRANFITGNHLSP